MEIYIFWILRKQENHRNFRNSLMIPTGSLGESYSPMMKVMKSTYQVKIPPVKLYDGIILVYEATPIQVWDYME